MFAAVAAIENSANLIGLSVSHADAHPVMHFQPEPTTPPRTTQGTGTRCSMATAMQLKLEESWEDDPYLT